jgi:hypothetical protein
MKKLSLLLALVVLLGLSLPVLGQDEEVFKDDLEVTGYFGVAIPSGGASDFVSDGVTNGVVTLDPVPLGAKTGFGTGFDIGYFLTPDLVLGFNFTYTQHTFDDDHTGEDLSSLKHRYFIPNFYLKRYFFGESNWAPWVKVHAGASIARFTTHVLDASDQVDRRKYRELVYDPSFGLGFGGGVLYYTSDASGIFLGANLHYGLTKDAKATYQDIDYSFGKNTLLIDIHLGIGVYFGG